MFQLPRFHRLIHNGGTMFVETIILRTQKAGALKTQFKLVTHIHSTQEVTDNYGMYWSLIYYVLSLVHKKKNLGIYILQTAV